MEPKFWHGRWEQNNIAFHLSKPHPLLTANLHLLDLKNGDRVFVPLCGKTVDIQWLLAQQIKVSGAELSQIAVEQLFAEMKVTPKIVRCNEKMLLFTAKNIEIFVGDIFDLTSEQLGEVNATYDRAALVALPDEIRDRYSIHLCRITRNTQQLLITYEYDQSAIAGPPFSIPTQKVQSLYGETYKVHEISRAEIPDGMKGKCEAQEILWHLKPKH